jgi:hypothetical protein
MKKNTGMNNYEIGSFFIHEKIKRDSSNTIIKYLQKYSQNYIYFDSGRSSIRFIAKLIKRKVVLLPNYLCDSIIQPFLEENCEILFYEISKDFKPLLNSIVIDERIGLFFHMGYFGFNSNDSLTELVNIMKQKSIIVVEDITHTIFSSSRKIIESDYYVCSIRKWIGIADGGILLSRNAINFNNNEINDVFVQLSVYANKLKSSFINGSILMPKHLEAYQKAENYLEENNNLYQISNNSLHIIQHYNFDNLVKKRRRNALFLLDELTKLGYSSLNIIDFINSTPIFVPLVLENKEQRDKLKYFLVKNKIYTPIHWSKPKIVSTNNILYEIELSIPCDHRYSIRDMRRIIDLVADFKESKKMITLYNLEQKDIWSSIVYSFKNVDIYYLPEYSEAFKRNGDGEPILIHYINGSIEAINVVVKRDISKIRKFKNVIEPNKIFDFTTPYGYGGILFKKNYSKKEKKTFLNEYINFCKNQNIVSEFIRFHPILQNYYKLINLIDISDIGPTVCIKTDNFNQTWANFTSKNRNVIRKSQKNGVKVYWGLSNELLNVFQKLYFEIMDKDNADQYYYFSEDFFQSLITDLKYKMLFFYAIYEEKIISISSVLFHQNYLHYHLSASDINYKHLSPTNLLLSEVARYASENGMKTFHLGGGLSGRQDNLYKFKKSFSKLEDCSFKVGKLVFNDELYKELIIGIDDGEFFPLYRKG